MEIVNKKIICISGDWYLTVPLGCAIILKNNEDVREGVNLIQSKYSEKCRRHVS